MKVYTFVDLRGNQIKNAVIDNADSPPSNPKAGQIYYNTTSKTIFEYNGEIWIALVADSSYVHTDNNFTTEEKDKLSRIEPESERNKVTDVRVDGTSVVDEYRHANISFSEYRKAEDQDELNRQLYETAQRWVSENYVSNTELDTKFQIGTTEYWNSKSTYLPRLGDVIIYSDYETKTVDGVTITIPGIKVGSGNAYLSDLAFVGEKERDELLAHIADPDAHITVEERDFWNNKLNVDDTEEVVGETLILNRN